MKGPWRIDSLAMGRRGLEWRMYRFATMPPRFKAGSEKGWADTRPDVRFERDEEKVLELVADQNWRTASKRLDEETARARARRYMDRHRAAYERRSALREAS